MDNKATASNAVYDVACASKKTENVQIDRIPISSPSGVGKEPVAAEIPTLNN